MIKRNLTYALWLFLFIATFLSCGDAAGPSIGGMKFRLSEKYSLSFGKYTASKTDGFTNVIQECNIGDTIALSCSIEVFHYDKESMPETITMKINTLYGSGRATLIRRTTLGIDLEAGNGTPVFYSAYLVPTTNRNGWKYPAGMVTLQQYNYWINKLETWETPYGTLPVSPDGDILTAEVTYKNKIIKTSLTIIGETK